MTKTLTEEDLKEIENAIGNGLGHALSRKYEWTINLDRVRDYSVAEYSIVLSKRIKEE